MQELFEYWINILDPPNRYFVSVLSHFAPDPLHRDKLKEFASKTAVSVPPVANILKIRKENPSTIDTASERRGPSLNSCMTLGSLLRCL